MNEQMQSILRARDYIRGTTSVEPQFSIVLGSGLGGLSDDVLADAVTPFTDIPGFPWSSVPGHAGKLVIGTLAGKNVVIMQGRLHYYKAISCRSSSSPCV